LDELPAWLHVPHPVPQPEDDSGCVIFFQTRRPMYAAAASTTTTTITSWRMGDIAHFQSRGWQPKPGFSFGKPGFISLKKARLIKA
jgi:hypothetical protein